MTSHGRRSRRDFLTTAATGAAAAGLAGLPAGAGAAPDRTGAIRRRDEVIHRTLGRTGIRLPIVSMGVMNTDDANLIRRSYEHGVRHFDTAAGYMGGRNEEVVGATLRDMGIRDEVVIATKVLHSRLRRGMTPEQLRDAIVENADQSLRRLGMEQVEILYLHDISTVEDVTNPGFLEGMARIKEQGKARFTGFSCHRNQPDCIRAATEHGGHDVILAAWNYAYAQHEDLGAAMRDAVGAGIGIVAMKTQCVSQLTRRNVPAEGQTTYPDEVMHSAVLKWALQPDSVTTAITGYTTFQQLEQNFRVASDPVLTEQEQAFLDDHRTRSELGFCLQCGECVGTCPQDTDIPTLMRVHLYAAAYTNFGHARDTLGGIVAGRGLENCARCASCSARCANTVDIASRIAELKSIYV